LPTAKTDYDEVGNPEVVTVGEEKVANEVVPATLRVTTTVFDALNRPGQITHPDGTKTYTRYTATGLAHQTEDELGRKTNTEYDLAGRPVKVVQDAAGIAAETITSYDDNGNVASTTNPNGKVWTF
jgi:uncharacterized protein RhaS with RHS repeats